MANQNPQPEIYTTRHSFDAAATQGTTLKVLFNSLIADMIHRYILRTAHSIH